MKSCPVCGKTMTKGEAGRRCPKCGFISKGTTASGIKAVFTKWERDYAD